MDSLSGCNQETVMLPQTPEEWPALFERHLASGDLHAVSALYAPEACFVSPHSGETITGRDQMRAVLSGLIESNTRLHGKVVKSVVAGDVAVLYTDWHAAGERSRAIEVLRRQPDGTWLLVVGDPHGRG
jgi:ketosteroid isomerase-like protein